MKKTVLSALLTLCLLGGSAQAVTLWVAADLHYLAPALTDGGPLFERLMASGDGKLTERMPQVLDAWVAQALAAKPDAIILCGDLTFNGELASLKDLLTRLSPLRSAGIPVLVMPGNHDIAYPYAASYFGSTALRTAAIPQADFAALCEDFGYGGAISRDPASNSYVWALTDQLRILLLDANTETAPGALKPETLCWAEEALRGAKESGAAVISVTHQNVLQQSAMFAGGAILGNAQETADLLRRWGVRLNLSGHAHLQHTAERGGLTDISTGSMSVYPLRYGILTLEPERTVYEPAAVGVCLQEAQARFRQVVDGRVSDAMAARTTPEELETLSDFAFRVNSLFFAGELDAQAQERLLSDPGWILWQQAGSGSFWLRYLQTILTE